MRVGIGHDVSATIYLEQRGQKTASRQTFVAEQPCLNFHYDW